MDAKVIKGKVSKGQDVRVHQSVTCTDFLQRVKCTFTTHKSAGPHLNQVIKFNIIIRQLAVLKS